jgi:small conductance mechanosensitive channel
VVIARTLPVKLPTPEHMIEMGVQLALTAIVAFLFLRLLFLLIARTERFVRRAGGVGTFHEQRARTLGGVLRSACTAIVAGAAFIHGLEIFGWNVGPLLAGAGVLGVAIGFGAQTLVRDVIAGMFILAENQFSVGEVIEVAGAPATVEEISVRSTTLRDGQGFVHFVPNGEIRTVVNRSRGWNRAMADVVIAPDEDAELALERCRAATARFNADPKWRDLLLDPAEVWGIESLGPDAVRLRVAARTRPGADAATVARELRVRMHRALRDAGIRSDPRWELRATEAPPAAREPEREQA